MEKKKPIVVRVTKEEFELNDGRIFPHIIELDKNPTIKEFQKIYDKVRAQYKDLLEIDE